MPGLAPFARHTECHNWSLLGIVVEGGSASWVQWIHVVVLGGEVEVSGLAEGHMKSVALLSGISNKM